MLVKPASRVAVPLTACTLYVRMESKPFTSVKEDAPSIMQISPGVIMV